MSKKRKVKIGDVFKFVITEEIMRDLEVQPEDVIERLYKIYNTLENKIGYGIVVNEDDTFILVQLKRVDVDEPSIMEIEKSKSLCVLWTWGEVLFEKEYEVIGHVEVEPIEIEHYWFVRGRDYKKFHDGMEVEILIQTLKDDVMQRKTIGSTYDVNIIRTMEKDRHTNTHVTLMMEYLNTYNRDENDIQSLKF
ncbi:hypothetical protein SAMN05444401_2138 [Clostridium amylolyticum]|uniref:Uncharacterized protein n=1 Tax=Clostridium amylolyticum TaxID=1121298 RepID=A0A1M6GJ95_9CLOT|nr:hypothetical protein [Clostridium amylolyticum]SHJ09992.1 hypothetical protein SAMN05444401_2138 [Clostridium amylolyticum]